jgi:hypothetical protein
MSEFVYSFCYTRENVKAGRWLGDAAVLSGLGLVGKKLTPLGQNFVRTPDISRYSDEEQSTGTPVRC